MPEFVVLVDHNDRALGKKDFTKLKDSDRWRIITVRVTNKDGEILIAKRSATKKLEPNLWEPTVSGTVKYGESYEECAHRELFEELGLSKEKLILEKVVFFKAAFGKRSCGLFRTIFDPASDKITLSAEEVAEVKWVSSNELVLDLKNNPTKYVKNFPEIMEYFKQ